jgi:acetyl-CoA carboxylase biotin carboxyl carrier protein
MTIDEIVTLIQAVSDNGLTSFVYEEGDQKLVLKKKKKKNVAQAPVAPVVISQPAAPMMGTMPMQAAPAAVSETPEKAAEEKKESTLDIGSDKVVTSPLVGTFYSSASPEAEAFVKEGDTVKKGQVLGIIEAMKLMNEIESEYDGVVEAVLVNNEDVVEYGQPLFRIR